MAPRHLLPAPALAAFPAVVPGGALGWSAPGGAWYIYDVTVSANCTD
ncbi:hypothetical protein ABT120_60070 [Nonomuraea angiospora]